MFSALAFTVVLDCRIYLSLGIPNEGVLLGCKHGESAVILVLDRSPTTPGRINMFTEVLSPHSSLMIAFNVGLWCGGGTLSQPDHTPPSSTVG